MNLSLTWPYLDLALTLPRPYLDLALTLPWPCPDLALTLPRPCPDLALTLQLSKLELIIILPEPCLDHELTLPWPCLDLALTFPLPCLELANSPLKLVKIGLVTAEIFMILANFARTSNSWDIADIEIVRVEWVDGVFKFIFVSNPTKVMLGWGWVELWLS